MSSGLLLKQFDLCERLGMTLEVLEETMSVRELIMWVIRDRNHFSQSWHQAAMLAATNANCHAAEGKKFRARRVPALRRGHEPDRQCGDTRAGLRGVLGDGDPLIGAGGGLGLSLLQVFFLV